LSFAATLLEWYGRHGRSALPWRTAVDPYRTVVSEFMLQQTQVDRVIPLFEAFVAAWPDFAALAVASRADVVRAWKGLGYNSRAVRLHQLAQAVCERHGGTLPLDEAALRELPGVGPYTARAIAAFAFGMGVAALDTNVRRIVQRTQFGIEWPRAATLAEIDTAAAALVPEGAGHAFNSAMMDLGSSICTTRAPKCLVCPLRPHCAAAPIDPAGLAQLAKRHAKPAPSVRRRFEDTDRFVRGRIVDRLRELPPGDRISLLDLHAELEPLLVRRDMEALRTIASALALEGILDDAGDAYALKA
jgi:A/G-specific adenine glycosylase